MQLADHDFIEHPFIDAGAIASGTLIVSGYRGYRRRGMTSRESVSLTVRYALLGVASFFVVMLLLVGIVVGGAELLIHALPVLIILFVGAMLVFAFWPTRRVADVPPPPPPFAPPFHHGWWQWDGVNWVWWSEE